MAMAGAGLGLTMQVMVVAMQNSVERRYLGVGTSTVTFFRSVGGSCGVALFGAIFNHRLAGELTGIAAADLLDGHSAHGGLIAALAAAPRLATTFVLVLFLAAARSGDGAGSGGRAGGDGGRVTFSTAVPSWPGGPLSGTAGFAEKPFERASERGHGARITPRHDRILASRRLDGEPPRAYPRGRGPGSCRPRTRSGAAPVSGGRGDA
jgi:hypothetical protein